MSPLTCQADAWLNEGVMQHLQGVLVHSSQKICRNLSLFISLNEIIIETDLCPDCILGRNPMDSPLHLAVCRSAASLGLRVVAAMQLLDAAILILHYLIALDDVAVLQAHLPIRLQAEEFLRSLLHKILLLYIQLPRKWHIAVTALERMVLRQHVLLLPLRIVGNNHLQRAKHCHNTVSIIVQIIPDAPHFQAVGHVPHGAFHAAAGCGGYSHGLLFTHFRQRPVDHPPGPQVVQKIHHGACGMIHIHRTCQDQQLRLPDGRREGFQRRKMGTAAQICLKASAAAQAGPVKIPRQEELPDLPAHLAGKVGGEIREFFLPRDFDRPCLGCGTCFQTDLRSCPHFAALEPLAAAIREAELLILASPVYVYHATGAMMNFLDHLGTWWVVHRPLPEMSEKQAVAIATAAGGGMKSTVRDMADSLEMWGVRDDLNNNADRIMAVLRPLKVVITNYPEGQKEYMLAENHPFKGGHRYVPFTRELYIEQEDFMEEAPKKFFRLKPDGEVRLKHGYIIKCDEVVKNEDGSIKELHCSYDPESKTGGATANRKVKGTIHWVSAEDAVRAEVRLYDYLIETDEKGEVPADFLAAVNKNSLEVLHDALVEPSVRLTGEGTHYQFLRQGYYVVDKDSTPEHLVFNRVVGLKDSWAKAKKG